MQAYGHILYMDVQKTGSTFVTRIFDEVLDLPKVEYRKHSRLKRPKEPGEFVVLSSRDPLDAWVSLYNFGCEGKGRMRLGLDRAGVADAFYAGDAPDFAAWVRYLHDPANASIVGERYEDFAHLGIGFQNYRELVMSIARPEAVLADVADRSGVVAAYERGCVVDVRLRHASLVSDLEQLLTHELAPFVIPGLDVRAVLDRVGTVNASHSRLRPQDVDDVTRAYLSEIEWLTPVFEERSADAG